MIEEKKIIIGCICKLNKPEGSVQEAPVGSCCGDCLGKTQGLKVEADAILDGALTNSPESLVYHGRV